MKNPPIAWLYKPEMPGLLQLGKKDQLTFIQRQTTNDTNTLSPETGQVSVLTTPLARILDVFFIFMGFNPDEPVLNLVTLPGRAKATSRYLKSRIFFNDQVSLQDASETTCQFWLDGPQAAAVLAKAGASDLPPLDGVRRGSLAGQEVVLIGRRGLNGAGYLVVVPEAAGVGLENALVQAGAVVLSHSDYDTMRIAAGLPGSQSELTEAYTPFEVDLGYAVSGNKGCYTGQEILARQVTYDKITRRLCGIRLSSPAAQGSGVLAEGKPAGEITSSTIVPGLGPIALAVIKRPFFEPGTAIQVKAGEEFVIGTTCKLPFLDSD
jgi:folate-binding protein YgfZ